MESIILAGAGVRAGVGIADYALSKDCNFGRTITYLPDNIGLWADVEEKVLSDMHIRLNCFTSLDFRL